MKLNGFTIDDVAGHFLINEWDDTNKHTMQLSICRLHIIDIIERGKDWIYNGQTDLLDLYEFEYEYDPEDAYLEITKAPEYLAGLYFKSAVNGIIWKSDIAAVNNPDYPN